MNTKSLFSVLVIGLVLTGGHYHDIERYHDFKIMICIIMIINVPNVKNTQRAEIELASVHT